ncbi:MAG: Uma2 family endonuclease [Bryobacteraceae bacterium]
MIVEVKTWTREECQLMLEAGLAGLERYELIGGRLCEKERKGHRYIWALMLLGIWLRGLFGGLNVVQGAAIDVSGEDQPRNEPEPDMIVLRKSIGEYKESIPPAEILLLVEVSDTRLGFDLTTKGALYARAGIDEYWVMDVPGRRVIVHRGASQGRYQTIDAYFADEQISPLCAPGASVLVARLFDEA